MPAWTHLYLVRHGSTSYTEEGRIQGQRNIPLSPQGLREAETTAANLASQLPPSAIVVTSDLDRAHHTARIIAEHLSTQKVVTMPLLRERSMGSSENALWTELPPGADHDWEPADAFMKRVLLGLRRVAERGVAEIVVVTHAGFIGVVRDVVGLAAAKTAPGEVLEIEVTAVGGVRLPEAKARLQ